MRRKYVILHDLLSINETTMPQNPIINPSAMLIINPQSTLCDPPSSFWSLVVSGLSACTQSLLSGAPQSLFPMKLDSLKL
ncbi:hypothetical protein HanXRQr2_Chr07g0315511 [Helianthus annuus]|uniref:Uncharacterized protein n=1 Tax=Helianthus annuus TaxID=4232 RepID=A0A9K3NH85_HELAN|nr:hypothetical protein HanXRQr2_Chr07g0315511 [Helianthus annuus]